MGFFIFWGLVLMVLCNKSEEMRERNKGKEYTREAAGPIAIIAAIVFVGFILYLLVWAAMQKL